MGHIGQLKYTNWEETRFFKIGEQPEGWIAIKDIPRGKRVGIPGITLTLASAASALSRKKNYNREQLSWYESHERTKFELLDWMRNLWNLTGIDLFVFSLIYNELELSDRELSDLVGENVDLSLAKLKEEGLIEWVRCDEPENHSFEKGETHKMIWRCTETALV